MPDEEDMFVLGPDFSDDSEVSASMAVGLFCWMNPPVLVCIEFLGSALVLTG